MIPAHDITVVMQGDIRPVTRDAVQSVRRALPGAKLILSTYACDLVESHRGLVDEMVVSEDPGSLPPYTVSRFAGPNNLNRQIVSTQEGLARASTPYVLKMRTDCLLESAAFVRLYEAIKQMDPARDRLIASTFYTRHPSGISGYLFHVSDWFIFGSASAVQQFWDVGTMSMQDSTWFERSPHQPGSIPSARRFRARYTPEQHIAVEFGRKRGYRVPQFLNDDADGLASEYTRFLANEFVIDSPEQLGFCLPKYMHLSKSLYQALDCVSHSDWREIFQCWQHKDSELELPQELSPKMRLPVQQTARKVLRSLAYIFRHPLILAGQARRSIRQSLANFRAAGGPSKDESLQREVS